MKFKILAAGALVVSSTACTIVPGSNMSRMNSVWFDDTPESYPHAKTNIQYIPINATLLSHLNSEKASHAYKSDSLANKLADYRYKVGIGDVLTITVWEHPELTIPSGSFRNSEESGNEVKADGTVFFPYAGDLHVLGLTTAQIKRQVTQRLSSVIKRPQVDVRVAAFKSQRAYVSGAVLNPGIIPITNIPLTLVDAIEQQGGLAPDAAWNEARLTRNGSSKIISLRSLYEEGAWSENNILQHGDQLHIPRNDSDKVFVLGEVNRPQGITMSRTGTTLAEALARANGINESRGDGRGIYVLRNTGITENPSQEPVYTATIYHLNAASAVGFMLADKFKLLPRDIVYVSPAPITRWNRFLSQLLPSIVATGNINNIESDN